MRSILKPNSLFELLYQVSLMPEDVAAAESAKGLAASTHVLPVPVGVGVGVGVGPERVVAATEPLALESPEALKAMTRYVYFVDGARLASVQRVTPAPTVPAGVN